MCMNSMALEEIKKRLNMCIAEAFKKGVKTVSYKNLVHSLKEHGVDIEKTADDALFEGGQELFQSFNVPYKIEFDVDGDILVPEELSSEFVEEALKAMAPRKAFTFESPPKSAVQRGKRTMADMGVGPLPKRSSSEFSTSGIGEQTEQEGVTSDAEECDGALSQESVQQSPPAAPKIQLVKVVKDQVTGQSNDKLKAYVYGGNVSELQPGMVVRCNGKTFHMPPIPVYPEHLPEMHYIQSRALYDFNEMVIEVIRQYALEKSKPVKN